MLLTEPITSMFREYARASFSKHHHTPSFYPRARKLCLEIPLTETHNAYAIAMIVLGSSLVSPQLTFLVFLC
jgi:hypothetical protein